MNAPARHLHPVNTTWQATDPVLAALRAARARRDQADRDIRILLAYARELVPRLLMFARSYPDVPSRIGLYGSRACWPVGLVARGPGCLVLAGEEQAAPGVGEEVLVPLWAPAALPGQ